jgi:hypothetical protein
VKEDEILNFVRSSIGSVWALEVLMLLRREPARSWRLDELVSELRSSPAAIAGASLLLEGAGLLVKTGEHSFRYQPASPDLDEMGGLVERIYAAKPATVIAALFDSRDEKLRTFAAAFRFKE